MAEKRQATSLQLPAVLTYQAVLARLTLPTEAVDGAKEALRLEAEALSPFEEGAYAVGIEPLEGSAEGASYWVAVASNEALGEAWYEPLKRRGALGSTRLDLTVFGWLCGLLARRKALRKGHWMVAIRVAQEQLIVLLNEGTPYELRALPPEASDGDFAREAMLLLAQASLAGRGLPQGAVCVAVSREAAEPLTGLMEQPPEVELLDSDEAADLLLQQGLRTRAERGATFDLTPQAWRDEARATRQRHLMVLVGSLVGVLWLAAAAVLFFLPHYYDHQAKIVEKRLGAQRTAYEAVLDLRERVNLIERYQDRSFSALEMLRLVCAVKAEGMVFLSMTYRQKQTLRFTGTAEATADVYALKDALQKDDRIREVRINRLVQDAKSRKQRFDVELLFVTAEEEME